jgi:hypothetical protein
MTEKNNPGPDRYWDYRVVSETAGREFIFTRVFAVHKTKK